MTEPADYTLHPAYLRGKADGFADGWDQGTRIANARWQRRLRETAATPGAYGVTRPTRFVGRARPLNPGQVAEIDALDAVWDLPSAGRAA